MRLLYDKYCRYAKQNIVSQCENVNELQTLNTKHLPSSKHVLRIALSSAARCNLTAVQFPLQVQHLRNAEMTAHSRYAVKPKIVGHI